MILYCALSSRLEEILQTMEQVSSTSFFSEYFKWNIRA